LKILAPKIDPSAFQDAFDRFKILIEIKSGHPFRNFEEGIAASWERYKPGLRDHARELLQIDQWMKDKIGSGFILERMIKAIEIQSSIGNLTNNLVFWQNRFGHANRDHRVLIEATSNPKLCREIESLLFDLFCDGQDEGETFEKLRNIIGNKYPLLAYIFFVHDMDRFMPIQPTGFDRAFREIDIEFSTKSQCSWDNYAIYNRVLADLQPRIATAAKLKPENIRLVDAHSFCWIFSSLLKMETEGTIAKKISRQSTSDNTEEREEWIKEILRSVQETVKNSNGQNIQQIRKNKELKMTSSELKKQIKDLLVLQQDRCALTGIKFISSDKSFGESLSPSLDRIDSNKHYEEGNLQVVCRFINFWKSDTDNAEFQRLLKLVRGVE
jgi:hypothetical protein